MQLYETNDYREYLRHYIKNLPAGGKGAISQMARHLGVQPSMVSQILKEKKNLTLEQATRLASYLGFENDETDYFLLLVQKARSGSKPLNQILSRQIQQMRTRINSSDRAHSEHYVIPESEKGEFYSAWYYSGVRLATALNDCIDAKSVCARLGISLEMAENVIQFLLRTGLCMQKNGKLQVGPSRTHLKDGSAAKLQHHMNWRAKGLARCSQHEPPEFFYSFPMCISESDTLVVREMLFDLTKRISALVEPSKPEKLVCLNIDWFDF